MSSTDVASPAAAMLERRPSRTTQEKRKQPCGDSESEGPETGSDGEWSGDDDPLSDHGREDEDEDEEETVLRGRVRPCRSLTAWSSTMGGTSRWQRRDGLAVLWSCVVWAPVEEQTWRSCLGARSTAATRMARSKRCVRRKHPL
eukprot:scaffold91061_cov64-Phaeocystis_antarctica.AAC.3